MQIQLPEKVQQIIQTLMQHGFEAYAVGGCIRDTLLGRNPKDWDITTSASPKQVKELFNRTIDTGIQHGTVTVLIGKEGFEVTTYRIDGEYEDGRHPKEVTFTSNLIEDLKRRDFTINAMAYNDADGLIDVFDGVGDLEKKRICCVGDARQRFKEDALRMMRAVRFSAQLNFDIDEKTLSAVQILAPTIEKVSVERIQVELVKLLTSDYPGKIRLLYETGLTKVFFPEFDVIMQCGQQNPHHCYSVGEHTIRAIEQIEPDKVLRLTMLLHDIAKPKCKKTDTEKNVDHFYGHPQEGSRLAKKILKRLKFDNDTIRKVCALVQWHDDNPELSEVSVRKTIYKVGMEQYPALFAVKKADLLAQSSYRRKEKLEYLEKYKKYYEECCKRGDCLSLKELAVNGSDLIQAGIKPGKELGETLNRLLFFVLEHPEWNKKEILLDKI